MEDLKHSETWRVFRIQSELVEGFETPNEIGPAVTVFGSSRMNPGSYYYEKAVEFGKYAIAFIIFPGGFGTMDELFEALTLSQTKKIGIFPIILFGKDYWEGLIDWFKSTLIPNNTMSPEDLGLISLVDEVDEVCQIL